MNLHFSYIVDSVWTHDKDLPAVRSEQKSITGAVHYNNQVCIKAGKEGVMLIKNHPSMGPRKTNRGQNRPTGGGGGRYRGGRGGGYTVDGGYDYSGGEGGYGSGYDYSGGEGGYDS